MFRILTDVHDEVSVPGRFAEQIALVGEVVRYWPVPDDIVWPRGHRKARRFELQRGQDLQSVDSVVQDVVLSFQALQLSRVELGLADLISKPVEELGGSIDEHHLGVLL